MTTVALDESLNADLEAMKAAGTLKSFRHITSPMDTEVTMAEKRGRILVLSSNNYLGLADHPEVVAAAKAALDEYGAGTASVRFICGTFAIHEEIEHSLARLSRTHAALTYVSCWAANTGCSPTCPRTPSSSPTTSAPPIPPPWTGPTSAGSPPTWAVTLPTLPSWPVP